ncbi:serine hydroxymethyltransferase [Patescibacteria group bacterium]|nr:serine hydroxymethyltransferase [Patescibacteria group bacterium]MCL5091661.1 serine hydroxymethyltransferase [Patescibacteria group bacterium]
MQFLNRVDPAIAALIKKEEARQRRTLMMIPSENYSSRAVQEALATGLTNKYSEGYAGARYYQGNRYIDAIESRCVERAKRLFHVPHVNVQPYSGSPANSAVYFALLSPGDTIMGLSLASGGHLTHGVPKLTFSGQYFHSVQYEVGSDGWIDYNALEKQIKKTRPRLIVAGTTHYPRRLDFRRFAELADQVGANLLADVSHVVGLIIAGVYPDPVPYADVITTTTHKTLRGPRAAMIMVTNKGLKRDPQLNEKIDRAVFPGLQGGPHNNTIAALAVALKEAGQPGFIRYGKQIVKNAARLAERLHQHGYQLVSGGTDTHVLVIDLRPQALLGNTVAEGLEAAGIVTNRNKVPFDPNPAFYPSGVRLGTPALTSRGMQEKQMEIIADAIDQVIRSLHQAKASLELTLNDERKKTNRANLIRRAGRELKQVNAVVTALCRRFPVVKEY